jgi:hypothetical protein
MKASGILKDKEHLGAFSFHHIPMPTTLSTSSLTLHVSEFTSHTISTYAHICLRFLLTRFIKQKDEERVLKNIRNEVSGDTQPCFNLNIRGEKLII